MPEEPVSGEVAFTLDFRGETYRFSPPDNVEVAKQHTIHLERNAWLALERAPLDRGQYLEQSQGLRGDLAVGLFEHGAPRWFESFMSPGNRLHILWLMANHAQRTQRETVEAMWADKATRKKLNECFNGYWEKNPPSL